MVSVPEKEIANFTSKTPTTISVEALGGRTYQGGTITKGVEADGTTHTYICRMQTTAFCQVWSAKYGLREQPAP